jgi:hypothetical protein
MNFRCSILFGAALLLASCNCDVDSTNQGGAGGSDLYSCLRIKVATEFNTFVDADCAGDRAFVADYNGVTVVRVLSNDPVYNGTLLGRHEEVPEIWQLTPQQTCEPFVPSEGFAPPYHRWAAVECETP